MTLGKSKELQTRMDSLECIDSIRPELGISGIVKQSKLLHTNVGDKLATPMSHASE